MNPRVLRYNLDSLGWYAFESLMQSLLKARLGLGVEAWGGDRADHGIDAYFSGTLDFPTKACKGTFLFQSKFVQAANAAGARPSRLIIKAVTCEAARISRRLKAASRACLPEWIKPPSVYALFTNSPVSPDLRRKVTDILRNVMPKARISVQDGNDLCCWLDANPDIALAFPPVLGLSSIAELVSHWQTKEVMERSVVAITEAEELAKVFVHTTVFGAALEKLYRHHFVILEGPPEMGKTAVARMVACAKLASGWTVYECRNPEDFLVAHKPKEHQVFVADDFFGRTEYDPARVRQWETDLPYILPKLNAQHWLLLTSRKHLITIAERMVDLGRHSDTFPRLGEVLVDAASLTRFEKALILYRHARAHPIPKHIALALRASAEEIVKDPHFTPERIRRFMALGLQEPQFQVPADAAAFQTNFARYIAEPTRQMKVSFKALHPAYKWFLIALVESESRGAVGPSSKGALGALVRERFDSLCPVDQSRPFDQLAHDLTEAFVRRSSWFGTDHEHFSWTHPSCRDLVIDELTEDSVLRRRFLSHCVAAGLNLTTSAGGAAMGQRAMPLLTDEHDWEIFASRLQAVSSPEVLELLYENFKALSTLTANNVRVQRLGQLLATEAKRHIAAMAGRNFSSAASLKRWFEIAEFIDEIVPPESYRPVFRRKVISLNDLLDSSDMPRIPASLIEVASWVAVLDEHTGFIHAEEDWTLLERLAEEIQEFTRGNVEDRPTVSRLDEDDVRALAESYEELGKAFGTMAVIAETIEMSQEDLLRYADECASIAKSLVEDLSADSEVHEATRLEEVSIAELFSDLEGV